MRVAADLLFANTRAEVNRSSVANSIVSPATPRQAKRSSTDWARHPFEVYFHRLGGHLI